MSGKSAGCRCCKSVAYGIKEIHVAQAEASAAEHGQDNVYVEVYVNGTLVHEGEYPSDTGTVPVDISGSGEVNVTAYVDGVAQSQTIDFGG